MTAYILRTMARGLHPSLLSIPTQEVLAAVKLTLNNTTVHLHHQFEPVRWRVILEALGQTEDKMGGHSPTQADLPT
jgi:hypothetical protein